MPPSIQRMRDDARRIFQSGIDAVEPRSAVLRAIRHFDDRLEIADATYTLSRYRRIAVIGAGKAGAPMASALEEILGERIAAGVLNVKYGHTLPLDRIELVEAGHPLPDVNGQQGSQRIYDILAAAGEDDLIICLLSGGGSALLPLPVVGLTLGDLSETTDALLSCGAKINEINAVRKHMSRVQGGNLAGACHPAALICLILSDVVGDDLDVIASGPTVPDRSTFQECMDIFCRYRILEALPKNVVRHFEAGLSGTIPETPKATDPIFHRVQNVIIGNNIAALSAARQAADHLGYHTLVLSSLIEGEARQVAPVHAAIAKEVIRTGNPLAPPACLLSGGETTVTIEGNGLGGRNQEFALAAALSIAGESDIVMLCAGTDGTDGPTDATGAFADSRTIARADALQLNPDTYLANNDAYHFFEALGDLLITGPTNTNVMDLCIILIRKNDDFGI